MQLEKIKSLRKSEIEKLAISPVKRKLKKIVYLLKYGMPLGKFITYSFSYLFIIPIAKIKISLKNRTVRKEYFGNETLEKSMNEAAGRRLDGKIDGKKAACKIDASTAETCYIAVNIGNAGIGDAIVAIRFLRDFRNYVNYDYKEQKDEKNGSKSLSKLTTNVNLNGSKSLSKLTTNLSLNSPNGSGRNVSASITFDVFYRSPDSIKFITAALPDVRRVLNLPDYTLLRKFYDIDLKLNTFFIKEEIKESSRDKISKKFPSVLKIIENIKTNRSSLEKYLKTRPFSEGILSDAVTAMGLSRAFYLNRIAGISDNIYNSRNIEIVTANKDAINKVQEINYNQVNTGILLDLDIDSSAVSKFNLQGKKFITIHDGWDENTRTKNGSSTKSYPPQKWSELAILLQQEFPDYTVVQLGGLGNGSDINGIGLNLRGKTTLKEAASILAASSLHIDTDSGLVHIAVSLGTPCAVLFGPTNAEYCSYSHLSNYIAVTPNLCGNCWWSTDDWMEKCPRGLDATECMNSIEPIDIINKIKIKLNAKFNVKFNEMQNIKQHLTAGRRYENK